jgi:hypothetical protein
MFNNAQDYVSRRSNWSCAMPALWSGAIVRTPQTKDRLYLFRVARKFSGQKTLRAATAEGTESLLLDCVEHKSVRSHCDIALVIP